MFFESYFMVPRSYADVGLITMVFYEINRVHWNRKARDRQPAGGSWRQEASADVPISGFQTCVLTSGYHTQLVSYIVPRHRKSPVEASHRAVGVSICFWVWWRVLPTGTLFRSRRRSSERPQLWPLGVRCRLRPLGRSLPWGEAGGRSSGRGSSSLPC